ncbi:MAG: N-acetylneuraminate synthase family protein [Deltaproteobacteria bacterium]|nr:N-acetylneuraminate synthase family protein [Deltaproteobacteria bacterium]
MSEVLFIESHKIGPECKTFIIGEIAQAHDGSLGTAHAYIDAIADAGADAVKFQTHFAGEESTIDEPFRVRFSRQDSSRYDYWKRMEFSEEQWVGLANHAKERGILFLSSAFSIKAIELLRKIGVPAWKVASGEIGSHTLLREMAKSGSPILLSTGMSDFNEIDNAVSRIKAMGLPFAIFQCTSKYPTRFEEVGLNIIDELRDRYCCPVGLSDHTGSIFPGLAAMARNVDLLEIHVTFDKRLFGPDIKASVTIDELRTLVEASEAFHKMFANPVDKNAMSAKLTDTKAIFSKSIAPLRHLKKGTILESDMLSMKKPGTGIPPNKIETIIGRRLARDVDPDRLLAWEDIV